MSLTHKTLPIADLKLDPKNARRHPTRNLAEIKKSLTRFGQQKPIVIDSENVVRAGNGTLIAAQALGWTEIAVVQSSLNGKELAAFAVSDNRTAELAEWDHDVLADLLRDTEIGDIGFTDSEAAEALAQSSDEDRLEDEPPVLSKDSVERRAAAGDLWAMGPHRLLCGDSTVEANLLRLVGEERASMIFTDPPYNVAYEGKTKECLTIQNDSMTNAKFRQFLRDAFAAAFAACSDGSPIYVCHADCEVVNFRLAMDDAGWLTKQCLIWVKNTIILGRKDYQFRHEPILYGWKPGKHRWYGGRNKATTLEPGDGVAVVDVKGGHEITVTVGERSIVLKVPSYEVAHDSDKSTVIKIDKPCRNAEHPTIKPIALPGRAIKNSSKPGDIVLDPFLGSGSTLMACDLLNRRCFGLELDPHYCDVILTRWEMQSGLKAQKLS